MLIDGLTSCFDLRGLVQAIRQKRFGDRQKEIEDALKTMNYSDEYIEYLLEMADVKWYPFCQ